MTQAEFLESFNSKNRDFSMFSAKGNRRVQAFVKKCIKKLFGKAMRKSEFEAYVSAEAKKVASQDAYSEMGDTAVREVIYFYLEKAIAKADYEWDYFEYSCY